MKPEIVLPRWSGCIVAATGPSLTEEVAESCKGYNVIAVNDAYRRLPFADVLYACDASWWSHHNGCPQFKGEKWSSHEGKKKNYKLDIAERYGLRLVLGRDEDGFSMDPSVIHYGGNSGFQAINLAILFGCGPIVLVGFDMTGGTHFFGDHPPNLRSCRYERFIPAFVSAAKSLQANVQIINANEGSGLDCFPKMPLADCLANLQRS